MTNVKFQSSVQLDEAIILLYRRKPARGAIVQFSRKLGLLPNWVSRRARTLGAARTIPREQEWSDAEREILERNYSRSAPYIRQRLAEAGFQRTELSISKRRALNLCRPRDAEFMTASTLAGACGVDRRTVIQTWIKKLGLRAIARGSDSITVGEHQHFWIAAVDFRAWADINRKHIDLRKVDASWFWNTVIFPDQQPAKRKKAA